MSTREQVQVVVDDDTLARGDTWTIIEPVWYSVDIFNGHWLYEHSLQQFSEPQRFLVAVRWYLAEVMNGGHRQFYSNATGVVWRDALNSLKAIDIPQAAEILQISANRLGGEPSFERDDRSAQLLEYEPEFTDCDKALYRLLKKVDFNAKMLEFIRANPSAFYFSGTISRPVRTGP